MITLKFLFDAFWSEQFWLPPGVTWQDIEDGTNNARLKDLLWALPISICLILLKIMFEYSLFRPIGVQFKISDKKVPPLFANATLEKDYKKTKRLTSRRLDELSIKCDVEPRDIERWWRRRRAQDRSTCMDKFCESCWKFTFYACSFSFGLFVLWDKSYLWNIMDCAYEYPHHAISGGVWYYYMISLSFYWSSTFTHFFKTRRKDFWQMFSHHIVTVLLISLSWVCNIHRAGSLFMVTHDCADIFLEAAKAFKYAKFNNTSNKMFKTFALVWVVSRLIFFPRIVFAAMFQTHLPYYPVYFLLISMSLFLLCLHLYWTYLILIILINMARKGEFKDCRSNSEDE